MKRELIYRCKRCNEAMALKVFDRERAMGFFLGEHLQDQFMPHECRENQYGVAELIGANEEILEETK